MAEKMDPCKELMECISEYNQILKNSTQDALPDERSITEEYNRRIESLLKNHTLDTCFCLPIHELLDTGLVAIKIELIVDILQLLASKFDVNAYDTEGNTCIHVAIKYCHFGVIRLLVDLGSDRDLLAGQVSRNIDLQKFCKGNPNYNLARFSLMTPIASLACQPNVPLDMFDLLKTDHNLNSSTLELPLHNSICCSQTASAVHLIHIGARVNQKNRLGRLPVSYYDSRYIREYNDELFTLLISTETNLLRMLGHIVHEKNNVVQANNVLERLCERMIPESSDLICKLFVSHGSNDFHRVVLRVTERFQIVETESFRGVYLMSLFLILMDWNIPVQHLPVELCPADPATVSIRVAKQFKAIGTIWRLYANKSRVRPLFNLCMIQIKRSMNSLSEESFQSLPLPPVIRNRLMYRDVAKTIYEAYCAWPRCDPSLYFCQ